MPSGMRTFVCRWCCLVERARGAQVWHPCSARLTKTGRPQMVEMTPDE